MAAKLARFYSWSPNIIDNLTFKDAQAYFFMIERVEAEERLMDLTASDYPNMKKESRSKVHKSLVKLANKYKQEEQLTTSDFAKKLGIDKWQMTEQKS